MKLQIFCATAITFTSWGCEGLLDEQAAGTLSQGSGEARLTTYLVGVTMADSTHKANTRDVNLGIYRRRCGQPYLRGCGRVWPATILREVRKTR